MIDYERPAEPDDFQARVHDARRKVEQAVVDGERPEFEPLWQRYKSHFALAQHGKCAFCERNATAAHPHVDHFAPKSELYELPDDPEHHGREVHPGLPNTRGRRPSRKIAPGYWWRAYDWSNYLLVCGTCNSNWKQCYFPVRAEPRQWPPVPEVHEPPLLLNPFDDEAPWRSFRFDNALFQIQAEDAEGRATIDTLGLDRRDSLHTHRQQIARSAHRFATTLVRKRDRDALENLCELGGGARPFAGVVRAVAERTTRLLWRQLRTLHEIWSAKD